MESTKLSITPHTSQALSSPERLLAPKHKNKRARWGTRNIWEYSPALGLLCNPHLLTVNRRNTDVWNTVSVQRQWHLTRCLIKTRLLVSDVARRWCKCSGTLFSKQKISNNVLLWDGWGGWHINAASWELECREAKLEGQRSSETRWVGRDHHDRHLSLQSSYWQKAILESVDYLWHWRCSHTDLWWVSSQAACPAASETDTGERVHSSRRINLWTTFKVFIEVPQGD